MALPAGLLFLPPPPATPAFEQLKLPLTTRRAQTLRTRPRLPKQSQPTLSFEQQQQVLARVRAGESYRAIAPTFDVSYGTIYRLVQAARKRGAL